MPSRFPSAVLAVFLAVLPLAAHALEAGDPLPALRGKPIGSGALPELRGRVVYVDFWASWCVPCRKSMPVLDAFYREYEKRGFTVVGVNKDVQEAEAARFLQRVPVGFPLVMDDGDAMARAFGVKAMPSGYLVDRKGVIRQVHRGFTEETALSLARDIEKLLKAAP